jgi:hypothetical protein
MTKTVYMIEAVIDGTWHWYTGRAKDGTRLSGGTTWHTTNEQAERFTARRDAEAEARRIGGVTFIRGIE